MAEVVDRRGPSAPLRVYDGDEVDAYVAGLQAEIARLNTQIAEMSEQLAVAVSAEDLESAERALGRALLQAQLAAEEQATVSSSERDQLLEQTTRERDELRATLARQAVSIEALRVDTERGRTRLEAERLAVVNEAHTEAHRIVAQARADADRIVARAHVDAQDIVRAGAPSAQRQTFPQSTSAPAHRSDLAFAPPSIDLSDAPPPPMGSLVSPPAEPFASSPPPIVVSDLGDGPEELDPSEELDPPEEVSAVDQAHLLLPPPSGPPVIRLNGNNGVPAGVNGDASGRRFRRRT